MGTKQFDEPFKSRYMDETNEPLFPFGFGLSYTTFAYSNLVVETPVVSRGGTLVVTATVKNTGSRTGDEIAQLYVRDLVASVTRPVKELKGFQRVTLAPGEERQLRFELDAVRTRLHRPRHALHRRARRLPSLDRPRFNTGPGRRLYSGSIRMPSKADYRTPSRLVVCRRSSVVQKSSLGKEHYQ